MIVYSGFTAGMMIGVLLGAIIGVAGTVAYALHMSNKGDGNGEGGR